MAQNNKVLIFFLQTFFDEQTHEKHVRLAFQGELDGNLLQKRSYAQDLIFLQPAVALLAKNKPENKNNPGGSWWGAARLSVGQVHWLHAWMALRAAWGGGANPCTASLSAVAVGDAHLEERCGTVMWAQGAGCPLVAQNGNFNDVSHIPLAWPSWGTGGCTICAALARTAQPCWNADSTDRYSLLIVRAEFPPGVFHR